MIKLLLLAVVPFMTEHRNVAPKTEVSTNFYGSVTSIVDNAYILAHGGGGGCIDTNAVRDIASEEIAMATNSLNQTLSDAISGKLDISPDLELYPHTKIYWYEEYLNIDGYVNMNRGLSVAMPVYAAAYESDLWDSYVANGETLPTYLASGNWNTAPNPFVKKSDISATDPTFSNAVLAVGLNIDTNSVAVLNDIASTFGGFPIEGTATTVGGLLAALAAAIAWLKKNKVGSFESVGGASATVENGVAKLNDFFTESNSLLTGTIDAQIKTNAESAADPTNAVTLNDNAPMTVTIATATADALAVTFGAARQTGGLRICELYILNGTASTDLTFDAAVQFVGTGDSFPACDAGINYFVFAEIAANKWKVTRETLKTITTPVAAA